MEIVTSNPEIRFNHCFIRFQVSERYLGAPQFESADEALQHITQGFNSAMHQQLSDKHGQTPGKIMHTKVFRSFAHQEPVT